METSPAAGRPHRLRSLEGGGRRTPPRRAEEGGPQPCRLTAPRGPRRVDAGWTSPGQQRPLVVAPPGGPPPDPGPQTESEQSAAPREGLTACPRNGVNCVPRKPSPSLTPGPWVGPYLEIGPQETHPLSVGSSPPESGSLKSALGEVGESTTRRRRREGRGWGAGGGGAGRGSPGGEGDGRAQ